VSKKKKIAIAIFMVFLIATIYYYFFISPRNTLQELTIEVERNLRQNNISKLQKITLEESFIYKSSSKGSELINKFEKGIVIEKAFYAYNLTFFDKTYEKSIFGTGIMKAKIDSEDRYFDITAVKDKGIWKIAGFNFPDYLDY